MKKGQSSKLALVMGVLFLLVGVGGVVGSWGAYFTDTNIEKHGSRTKAHLVKKVFLGAADGTSEYVLEYSFETSNGQLVNASRTVSKELWGALREGELLEVRYSEPTPKRNFPAGEGVTSIRVTIFVSVVASLFAAFGGALVWGFVHRNSNDA
jgi:hypothetical protein